MSISIDQWSANTGLFLGQVYGHISIKLSIGGWDLKVLIIMLFFAAFAFLLLLKYGDVEVNPGPTKKEARSFSCFHCNVNSISAHNNFSLLEAYNTIHKYIFCIPETYSDSSVSVDDTTLSLPGYNLVRSDYPSNIKRGGVCLLYEEKLYLRSIN